MRILLDTHTLLWTLYKSCMIPQNIRKLIEIFGLSYMKDIHNDPFDRIMMSQAKCENMRFLTADSTIAKYEYEYIMKY